MFFSVIFKFFCKRATTPETVYAYGDKRQHNIHMLEKEFYINTYTNDKENNHCNFVLFLTDNDYFQIDTMSL